MSTSPNAVSAFMLSLSEFACLVSEQLLQLGQSSNNEDLSQSFVLLSNPNPKAAFVQG